MPANSRPKVLLIGWDGADWEHIQPLLDEGLMPNLQSMISGGVMGNIATLTPILSPMLWNSVATGKLADEHGILGFTEPDPDNGGQRPFASTSRKVKAIWNILSQEGYRSNVVNWWASHPAEPILGTMVSNSFVHTPWTQEHGWREMPGVIHPPEHKDALLELRVHLTEIGQNEILPFIPRAAEVDQTQDRRLETFAKQLAQCVSIQAAGTWLMENQPWDFTAMYFEGIDHFCHGFMPYAPPKLPYVSQEKYDLYKDVIRGAYQFHDMMLGRQLTLAGEDAHVILCSDHGFLSGDHRPRFTPREPAGPAYWHRPLGIFVMKGPGIRQDELVFGTSLLDITPTILQLFGLPMGEDMKGSVRTDAFQSPPRVKTIPSWESVSGESGQHPPGMEMDKAASRELMEQFVALGYVEDPGKNLEEAAHKSEIEIKYNLSRVYMATNRAEQALEILQQLVEDSPWENRFLLNLARANYECGYLRQAQKVLEHAYPEEDSTSAVALALRGRIMVRLGETEAGMACLKAAEAKQSNLAGLHVEIARTYQTLRQWEKAKQAAQHEIALNPNSFEAHSILAAALLRLKAYEQAVDSALTSVSIKHWSPQTHYVLGVAAARLGWLDRAETALKTTIDLQANHIAAHRFLAWIAKHEPQGLAKAAFHQEIIRQEQARRHKIRSHRNPRYEQTFDLPDIPPPKDRWETLDKERPRKKSKAAESKEKSGKTFILVSGLPRSGTSLMMQMLAAGGLPPKTDGERVADTDNPQGYFEWEAIKQIAKQPELLDEDGLDSKAIKVISMLLGYMPTKHDYKIIFLTRPVEEVAASQAKMIDRLGTDGAQVEHDLIMQQLTSHREQVLRMARRSNHIELLEIEYHALIEKSEQHIQEIVEFIGENLLPNKEALASVVRPELYRQRT